MTGRQKHGKGHRMESVVGTRFDSAPGYAGRTADLERVGRCEPMCNSWAAHFPATFFPMTARSGREGLASTSTTARADTTDAGRRPPEPTAGITHGGDGDGASPRRRSPERTYHPDGRP